jgi:hypothetical protein
MVFKTRSSDEPFYAPVIYGLRRSSDDLLKIGRSTRLRERLSHLRTEHGHDAVLEFALACPAERLARAETQVHAILATARIEGEWFDTDAEVARAVVDVIVAGIDGKWLRPRLRMARAGFGWTIAEVGRMANCELKEIAYAEMGILSATAARLFAFYTEQGVEFRPDGSVKVD